MERGRGLENSGILSLMHMPHFGRTAKVDTFVKQLLFSFHGVYLWMNSHISIDHVDLVFAITRMPKEGVELTPFFAGKEKDLSLVDRMKEK